MFRFDVRHLAVVTWMMANAGLVAVIGDETGWGKRLRLDLPVIVSLVPDAPALALLGEYAQPALEKFPQTLQRPLFVPTRRPPPPPPPPEPPPKPTMRKGQFQLMGVMVLPETSYVILKDIASGKARRVELGQSINGILVQSVESERVILSQYDEIEAVVMKVDPSPKTPMNKPVTQGQPVDNFPGEGGRSRLPRASRQDVQQARSADTTMVPTTSPSTVAPIAAPLAEPKKDRFDNPLLRGWGGAAAAKPAPEIGK